MAQNRQPPARWNRAEVSHYLVPFLQLAELSRTYRNDPDDELTMQDVTLAQKTAQEALSACPEAYRQLVRVSRRADNHTFEQWFGGIDCDDDLLADALSTIEQALAARLPAPASRNAAQREATEPIPPSATIPTPPASEPYSHAPRSEQLTEDAALRRLFCISRTYTDEQSGRVRVRRADLLAPFVELCRESSPTERHRLEEHCRAAVHAHLHDYVRALSYYREHYAARDSEAHGALLPETHTCMQYLEQILARCDLESTMTQKKQALEYERGGLGWFGRSRKREIDAELHELSITALELQMEDERAACRAAAEPHLQEIERAREELARAPVTAFGRRRELRRTLRQAQDALQEIEQQSSLEALRAQRDALLKKKHP